MKPTLVTCVIPFLLLPACSGDKQGPQGEGEGEGEGGQVGTNGATCYGNGTCNAGLACNLGICEPEPTYGPIEVTFNEGSACVVRTYGYLESTGNAGWIYDVSFQATNHGEAGSYTVTLSATGLPNSPGGRPPSASADFGPYLIDDLATGSDATTLESEEQYDTFNFLIESSRTSGPAFIETDNITINLATGECGP